MAEKRRHHPNGATSHDDQDEQQQLLPISTSSPIWRLLRKQTGSVLVFSVCLISCLATFRTSLTSAALTVNNHEDGDSLESVQAVFNASRASATTAAAADSHTDESEIDSGSSNQQTQVPLLDKEHEHIIMDASLHHTQNQSDMDSQRNNNGNSKGNNLPVQETRRLPPPNNSLITSIVADRAPPHHPLSVCSSSNRESTFTTGKGTPKENECCVAWDVDADPWWLHNPTWEISRENESTQCFAPMQNKEKAAFFQTLYDLQWKNTTDCSQIISSTQVNSGYSASINWLAYSFLKALQEQRPFQIDQHDVPWLYGPQNVSSWAYCPSQDITCYFLPLSACPRKLVVKTNLQRVVRMDRLATRPERSPTSFRQFEWLKDFMTRPRQKMRRKLMELRDSVALQLPCITMHVRRADVGIPGKPYRRYASVAEYLDAAKSTIDPGANILLLTDDQSTIDEVHKYHSEEYHWMYLNRTRHHGVQGGWESHVPSGDGPLEVLAILTETHLAMQCKKIIHGDSGFIGAIRQKMGAQGIRHNTYHVATTVTKDEAIKWPWDGNERTAYFQKEMDEYRRHYFAAKKSKT